jgi:hypothetical protein
MHPKLHLPVLGHVFRVTGVMPVAWFVIEGCVPSFKLPEAHIDLFRELEPRASNLGGTRPLRP